MRPQDILILLKILTISHDNWMYKDIANELHISSSEVSEALNRCKIAKLIDSSKRIIHRAALKEFIIHGLKYVFPIEPGSIVKGVPTAHSAPPLNKTIVQGENAYVWAYSNGTKRGLQIEPLYKSVPNLVENDKKLYEILALVDAIRIGKAREYKIAVEIIEKIIDE
jgi:hypothetical protein